MKGRACAAHKLTHAKITKRLAHRHLDMDASYCPLSHCLSSSLPLPISKSAARMDVIIVIKPVCNGLCWPGFCYANAERLEACCRAARSNLFPVSWGEHTLGILHPSHEVRSAPTLLGSTHTPVPCVSAKAAWCALRFRARVSS